MRIGLPYLGMITPGGQQIAELQAVITAADAEGITKPTSAELDAYNDFLVELRDAGLLTRMKTGNIYGFGSVQFGTFNLKDAAIFRHTLPVAPTYTEGAGVKSNGTTSYINTNYKTNEYAGIESDLTTIVYISEDSTAFDNGAAYGADNPSSTFYMLRPLTSAVVGGRWGYAVGDNFPNTNNKGLYVLTYDGVNSVHYKDGAKDVFAATPVAPTAAIDVLLLARNGTSSPGGIFPTNFYTKSVAGFFRFDRFTDADELSFRTIWNTFRANIGLGITWVLTSGIWSDLAYWSDNSIWTD